MPFVHFSREPKEFLVSLSLEAGNTFLICILKQNSKNVFHVVRFDTGTLFSFDFSLNFPKSLLAMHYIACYLLSLRLACLGMKSFCFSQEFQV